MLFSADIGVVTTASCLTLFGSSAILTVGASALPGPITIEATDFHIPDTYNASFLQDDIGLILLEDGDLDFSNGMNSSNNPSSR